jgi:hypothetical protein
VELLSIDSCSLNAVHNIFPNFKILVEVIGENQNVIDYSSIAFILLKRKQRTIHVFFNNPFLPNELIKGNGIVDYRYDLCIKLPLDENLKTLKQCISHSLNTEIDSFYLKRNSTGSQLKDENKTLEDLAFVDESIIHVEVN